MKSSRFAVFVDSRRHLTLAEAVESMTVEVKGLPPVHCGEVGDHSVAVGDDAVKEPTRVDGGELFRIADQHDLPVAVFGLGDEPGEIPGGDHRRFVAHDHRAFGASIPRPSRPDSDTRRFK
ncbi:MAG TPA: hypothetical protein VF148_13210 [Acidimicrobiia bacterium]